MSGYELYLRALLSFAAVLVLIGLLAFLLRKYGNAVRMRGGRSQRRLAVVEVAAIDQRRRLVLIRRDGIEHLLLTGGPSDLVVESGIGAPEAAAIAAPVTPGASAGNFQRQLDQVRF